MKAYPDGTVLTVLSKKDPAAKEFEVTVDTMGGIKGFRQGRNFTYLSFFLDDHVIIGEVHPKLYTVDDLREAFLAGSDHIYEFHEYLEQL